MLKRRVHQFFRIDLSYRIWFSLNNNKGYSIKFFNVNKCCCPHYCLGLFYGNMYIVWPKLEITLCDGTIYASTQYHPISSVSMQCRHAIEAAHHSSGEYVSMNAVSIPFTSIILLFLFIVPFFIFLSFLFFNYSSELQKSFRVTLNATMRLPMVTRPTGMW